MNAVLAVPKRKTCSNTKLVTIHVALYEHFIRVRCLGTSNIYMYMYMCIYIYVALVLCTYNFLLCTLWCTGQQSSVLSDGLPSWRRSAHSYGEERGRHE